MEFDLSPLWISLKTATVATIFAFFAGIAAAGWMNEYKGKARGILDAILTLPLILPPTVVGFLLLLIFGINSPIGQLLKQWEIVVIFSWPATAIASTVVAFPLMYKTVLSSFEHIDSNLTNCARTLGSSELKIFWTILLPLAWPGVVAGTILTFARALGEFGATLMLAGSIPGKTQTMPIAIFFAAEAGDMHKALIWVMMMVAMSLLVIASIHLWDESQRISPHREGKGVNLLKGMMNLIVFHRWQDIGLNGTNNVVTSNGNFTNKQSHSCTTAKELIVNIEKDLNSFHLKVDFIADSNTLGLLGASGSGKSMTLRCIAGLVKPSQGCIILNGRVLFDAKRKINLPSRQRRIGFVFQNYALFPHMNVVQNIGFGLQQLPQQERSQRVQQYMEMMQLQGLENHYPHQLSGGQQQRVALARALAIEPEAILLDEPLSALDTYLRNQIETLLRKVLSSYPGTTLFITHKLEEAYRVSQNILVMSQGRVIANDSKENIFERSPNLAVAKLTECKNISRAQIINSQQITAIDWGCDLQILESIPTHIKYVGIRAHHIIFCPKGEAVNTFPCWVADTSETQHRVTVYLKLHQQPRDIEDYNLQVEVYKEKWANLKDRPFPWYVCLDSLRLMLMES